VDFRLKVVTVRFPQVRGETMGLQGKSLADEILTYAVHVAF
jgi:hypothetical protein